MSFRYGNFGTGFSRAMPPAVALRFEGFVKTRGRDVTVVKLTETGENAYGQPVYTESKHTEKAFVERDGRERDLPPGTVKLGSLRLFVKPWAAVGEDSYEVEVDGVRYHVTSLDKTDAYLEVEAERKTA